MLFVEELSRWASQGSILQRAVLWFLFWPLLLALSFVGPPSKGRDTRSRRSRRPQIS